MALESVLRRNHTGELQCRLVAIARTVSGHRATNPAQRGGFRSGCEVPHPGEYAVHALLSLLHPAVPVSQGTVRGGRQQGSVERVLRLRECRGGPSLQRNARAWTKSAMAGHAREADWHAADGCLGDHRILRTAPHVAGRTEQG